MSMLSWVVLLVNTLQSLNSLTLLWVLIPGAILRPLLLIEFHGSLMTVVVVSNLGLPRWHWVRAHVPGQRVRPGGGDGEAGEWTYR